MIIAPERKEALATKDLQVNTCSACVNEHTRLAARAKNRRQEHCKPFVNAKLLKYK